MSHGKTPETKLISSRGNKEGKRADRSATNKSRGNRTSADHPAFILSDLKCLAASWPFLSPGRGRGFQLTRVSWDLLPPLKSPSSTWLLEPPVSPGKGLCRWHRAFQSCSTTTQGPGHPWLLHISGKVGSDFVLPLEDSPGCLAPLQHPTMAGNVPGSRDGSILLHLPTSALGSAGGPNLQLPKPHH